MGFKEALALFFERSTTMQTYWSFYVTIVLAFIAFFGSTPRIMFVAVLMTVTFFVFAMVTLWALLDVTRQRLALKEFLANSILQQAAPERAALSSITNTLTLYTVPKVIWIHLIGDVFTVVAIWVLTLRGESGLVSCLSY